MILRSLLSACVGIAFAHVTITYGIGASFVGYCATNFVIPSTVTYYASFAADQAMRKMIFAALAGAGSAIVNSGKNKLFKSTDIPIINNSSATASYSSEFFARMQCHAWAFLTWHSAHMIFEKALNKL